MYVFPGTNQIVMHPDAKRLAALPRPELREQARTELALQSEAAVPDLERVMGLGQLLRLKGDPDFGVELVAWLNAQPTTNALDVACLFVSGYWSPERKPESALVARFIDALATHALPLLAAQAGGEPLSAPIGVTDSLVLALIAAFQSSKDRALRDRILSALLVLVPIAPYLQASSQSGFTEVTGLPVPPPPPAYPPESYRAYRCLEGPAEYYAIEHRSNHREVLRAELPVLRGRNLEVSYRILEPKLKDRSARALIFRCLLVELLEDTYRRKTTLVFYKNQATNGTASERYA
ncbi:MAG TPA: hypothetical protein VMI54_15090 [Polyangiaceae bacterium]|nr:hypothetical protein [Polyangiaceae bacterium]